MFRGFNLKPISFDGNSGESIARWSSLGKGMYARHRDLVKEALDDFVTRDGSLNGSRLRDHWFPKVNADIFISHSHDDEEVAITLAGWFFEYFGLKSFIDSCVWGYAGALLRNIDNAYCRIPGKTTYDYDSRNGSTSHVHMMLSTALGEMIDDTECIMFLNTPHSIISSKKAAENQTMSPWIYSEIATTRIVGKKPPKRHEINLLTENYNFSAKTGAAKSAAPRILYDMNLESLTEINHLTLNKWKEAKGGLMGDETLDTLYAITEQ